MQEVGCTTMWHIFFVNPKDRTWYSSEDPILEVALEKAVGMLTTENDNIDNKPHYLNLFLEE